MRQKDVQIRGHAIECRINAEDPYRFTPSPGRITSYHPPGGPGIRVDSHVYQGYTVPPNYDSMVGKVIAFGATREQALGRMRIALSEMVVGGIQTNIELHRELLNDTRVLRGGVSIHYLEQKLAQEEEAEVMPWIALTLRIERAAAETFSDALLEAGAQSVALEGVGCRRFLRCLLG